MSRFYYVSHPEVAVDPSVPVPKWGLSEVGRRRAHAMLEQPWVAQMSSIGSSPETKAMETAKILGEHSGVDVDEIENSHEIDRSATGFVSHDRHEALADRLFAEPTESAEGWERALDAQRRIVERFEPFLESNGWPIQVAVGHGGVGTLLLCHLLGVDIERSYDQPGQGHYWSYDCERQRVVHPWRPVDHIEPASSWGQVS